MSFDNQRKQFSREHWWYCEIEVNGQTFRFCENRSPLPKGFVGQPTLTSQNTAPARVDLNGGIGVRATASVTIAEHLDYLIYGTREDPVRFWVHWRARNIGYQGGRLSIFSGYIVDDAFEQNNFQRRDYVIESFSGNKQGVSISGKDALKLASGDRAKAPRKSIGLINADIEPDITILTLLPNGVGDIEYPTAQSSDPDPSFFIRIGDEVMGCTNRSGDVLTVIRGQFNTLPESHSINDVAQLCLYYNDSIPNINFDLLTKFASVPLEQIPLQAWKQEGRLHLPGLYEALITEPTNVSDLLKETGESAPHYMYWDERFNQIQFVAVKAPPVIASCFSSEGHLLEDTVQSVDQPDMRISTVVVRFGQFDPTRELDEKSNFRQAHVRITPNSIARYNGIEKYKFINSRWINNANRAAAVRLAARYGRRYENMPRLVNFSLDAGAADIWTGDPITLDSTLIVDENGNRFCMAAQVISASEAGPYKYQALEHDYGEAFDSDLDSDDPNQRLVVLSGELLNINLREIYDTLFPDADDEYNIVFVFDSSCVVGSIDVDEHSIETGLWPELITSTVFLDVRGIIAGIGGHGEGTTTSNSPPSIDGGPAINLQVNVTLSITGALGGGGGGGGSTQDLGELAAGGGGAGFNVGPAGIGTSVSNPSSSTTLIQATAGTNLIPGDGGIARNPDGIEPSNAVGGKGGELGETGQNGSTLGGLPGKAINLNGFEVDYIGDNRPLGEVS